MDPFSAHLVVRRFLKHTRNRARAELAEDLMGHLAKGHLAASQSEGEDAWAIAGIFSQIDIEYSGENASSRGLIASEQAQLEGLPVGIIVALRTYRDCTPTSPALCAALKLCDACLDQLQVEATAPGAPEADHTEPGRPQGFVEYDLCDPSAPESASTVHDLATRCTADSWETMAKTIARRPGIALSMTRLELDVSELAKLLAIVFCQALSEQA